MECSCSPPRSAFRDFERWISHSLTCTLTHVRTGPHPGSGRDTSAAHPNPPAPGSAASPHPPALHVGAPRRQAAALPTSPSLPRRGREGAALGSDGQSGRPIEPATAFPKGGRCSSDGPNERGARVGLPPGIPLARLAGLWVTRKLGGRRRRPRLRRPDSDSRHPPKPGRAPSPHGSPRSRGPRAEAPPGARLLLLGAHPLLLVTTKSRSGNRREGAGSGQGGTPSAARGSRAQKVGSRKQGRRARGSARAPRSEVCGGPPRGPRHPRRASLAKVWRRPPRPRPWPRAPRRVGAERAPLPPRPRFCVSRLLPMLRPAPSCSGRC